MWLHFGGTLTLKSDDGRGAGAGHGTCTPGQNRVHVGRNYGGVEGTCGLELRNCPLLLMVLLVGNV